MRLHINTLRGVAVPSEIIAIAIIVLYAYLVYIFADYQFTYFHELSHQAIFEYYGCQNITLNLKCTILGCEGKTVATCPKEVERYIDLANSLLEMRDYQDKAMFRAILSMFFILEVELIILVLSRRS